MGLALSTPIDSPRSAQRVRDNSKLIVDGTDLLGFPYTENSQTIDISRTGISFYLQNRPWIEDFIDITIYPSELSNSNYYYGRKAKGRIVRTGAVSGEKVFVAARFL